MIFLLVMYSVNFVLAVLDIVKEYIFIMDAILNKHLYVHGCNFEQIPLCPCVEHNTCGAKITYIGKQTMIK